MNSIRIPWTQRAYEALPVAPVWIGLAIALLLSAAFLAVELGIGRLQELAVSSAGERTYRDLRLALVMFVLVGYLPTAYLYTGRRAVRTWQAIAGVVDPAALAGSVKPGMYFGSELRRWGWGGIVVVLLAPLLEVGTFPWTFPYDVSTWNAEVPWQRAMTPIIGWWGGRLVFAVLKESYRLQDLADQMANFDLFDLRSLKPFGQQGLQNALLIVGLFTILSLFLYEEGFGLMIALAAAASLPVAAAGLLLPVLGVRRRIRLEKQRELEWCRNALREQRASRDGGADQRPGRLADALAYRDHLESVREWPFDTAAWLRFGLYLLIPVGSWLGGALVERVIDAFLK